MPCDFYVSINIFSYYLQKQKKKNPGKHLLAYVYSTE